MLNAVFLLLVDGVAPTALEDGGVAFCSGGGHVR